MHLYRYKQKHNIQQDKHKDNMFQSYLPTPRHHPTPEIQGWTFLVYPSGSD